MRIVSLLPSATEIVYALGLDQDLVGVTHECDWPEAARLKPIVSVSALPTASTPREVDRLVSASLDDGEPIYSLDEVAIRDLQPDLVLSQDLCAVCAVPSGRVNEALEVLGCEAQVLSLDPSSLGQVLDCIIEVGRVTGTEAVARELVDRLAARLTPVRIRRCRVGEAANLCPRVVRSTVQRRSLGTGDDREGRRRSCSRQQRY